MIGVKGQYFFIFEIAGKKDFIQEPDLLKFQTVEKAGNVLPQFFLEFETRDEDLLNYINEGNTIKVTYGQDPIFDRNESELLIQHSEDGRSGKEKIHLSITGILNKIAYHKNNLLITNKQSSFATLKQIAGKTFIFDSNVDDKATDKMNWIQHGISDKKFVNNVWLHSYIPNSFLGVGIGLDGRFILRDIKKKVSELNQDWVLSTRQDSDKHIVYDGDYFGKNKSGFINAWFGHKRVKGVYDLNDGDFSLISQDLKPLMALSNKLMRNSEIEEKNAQLGFTNSNVHENYHRAYLSNISNLAVYSTVSYTISFQSQYKNLKLLDTVLFKQPSLGQSFNSLDFSSGVYLIAQITKILSNRQFITLIEIVRESYNNPKGKIA